MPDLHLPLIGDPDTTWEEPLWRAQPTRQIDKEIEYKPIGPPKWSYKNGQSTATFQYRIPVADVTFFVANAVGYSEVAGTVLKRFLPIGDPLDLGMVAVDYSVEHQIPTGLNVATNEIEEPWFQKVPADRVLNPDNTWENRYIYALVSLDFQHVIYQLEIDSVVAISDIGERTRYTFLCEEESMEYVQIPRATLIYSPATPPGADANQQVWDGGGQQRTFSMVTMKWFRLPVEAMSFLTAKWRALAATVNGAILELPMYGDVISFDPETALFQPYRTMPRMSPHGFLEYDVELKWLIRAGTEARPCNWNKWIWSDGLYYRAKWKDPGTGALKDVYELTDHEEIFSLA